MMVYCFTNCSALRTLLDRSRAASMPLGVARSPARHLIEREIDAIAE
jgi:hypothetical protein